MNRRRFMLRYGFALIVFTTLALVTAATWALIVYVFLPHRELDAASKQIVQKHSEQIDKLTEYLKARPHWSKREENWGGEQEALDKLRPAFSDDTFHFVTVSSDGHHGLTSVKSWANREAGYILARGRLSAQGAKPDHKVYFGWSTEGEEFYVYEAWVPEAPHMSHFRFWVSRASLEGVEH